MRCILMIMLGWAVVSGCASKPVDMTKATREEARRCYAEFIQEMTGLEMGQRRVPGVDWDRHGYQTFDMKGVYFDFKRVYVGYGLLDMLAHVEFIADCDPNAKPDRAEVIRNLDVIWNDLCVRMGLDPNVRNWDKNKNAPAPQESPETEGDDVCRVQRRNDWTFALGYYSRVNAYVLSFADHVIFERMSAEEKAMREARRKAK